MVYKLSQAFWYLSSMVYPQNIFCESNYASNMTLVKFDSNNIITRFIFRKKILFLHNKTVNVFLSICIINGKYMTFFVFQILRENDVLGYLLAAPIDQKPKPKKEKAKPKSKEKTVLKQKKEKPQPKKKAVVKHKKGKGKPKSNKSSKKKAMGRKSKRGKK